MTQYLLLIHGNAKSPIPTEEWEQFFLAARESGTFRGGSGIGTRTIVGDAGTAKSSEHIAGYMRFDADDRSHILDLLRKHPVVTHGGSVELCELPKS